MGETKTPNFHDFGIFGRVLEPPNHLLFFWRPKETSNSSSKNPNHFWMNPAWPEVVISFSLLIISRNCFVCVLRFLWFGERGQVSHVTVSGIYFCPFRLLDFCTFDFCFLALLDFLTFWLMGVGTFSFFWLFDFSSSGFLDFLNFWSFYTFDFCTLGLCDFGTLRLSFLFRLFDFLTFELLDF